MPEKKAAKQRNLSALPSVACAILVAFALCLYIPMVSYLSNANFYSFTLPQLLLGMLGPFAAIAAVGAELLILISFVLRAKAPKRVYQDAKDKGVVSIFHVLLVVLVFCIWLEGSPLSRGLPQLTGETNIFDSTARSVWDTVIWYALLVAGIATWRILAKHYRYVLIGVFLLLGLGIGDAVLNSPPKPASVTATATANEVLDRAAFHAEDNVLVLVLDAMSTAVVQDYLATDPAAASVFDGFVLYQNNMETATSTQWALPSMLTGVNYAGGSAMDYQTALYDAPESAASRFFAQGYDVYGSSTISTFNRYMLQEASTASASVRSIAVTQSLYDQFLLRFTPYALKNAVSTRATITGTFNTTVNREDGNLQALAGITPVNYDERAYLALIHAIGKADSARPTFHFHHVNGAHKPYTIDSQGNPLPISEQETLYGLHEQYTWTVGYVQRLLDALKASGLYDTTTIVLLGDHGDRLSDSTRTNMAYARRAGLLIKPPQSTAPLAISDAPTSNLYLPDFLTGLHLEGNDLESLTADLPNQRSILLDGKDLQIYEGTDVTDLTLVDTIPIASEYPPTTLSMDTEYSLAMLGTEPMAYPLTIENADFSNGWGLRALEEDFSASFLVDGAAGDTVDVIMVFSTSALIGGDSPSFPPFNLTMRDVTSGSEATVTVDAHWVQVMLPDAVIADDLSLKLSMTIDEYPNPDTTQVSMKNITLANVRGTKSANLTTGVRYSLSRLQEDVIKARPLSFDNADLANGWGLRALGEEMSCAFSVNNDPGQKLDVTLAIATSAITGEYPPFTPYQVTVRDVVSGKEDTYTIGKGWMDITLRGVTVSDTSSIQLALSIAGYPDPDTMQVVIMEVQVDNALARTNAATILQNGVRYSLSTVRENVITAHPMSFDNGNITNGWGLRALGNEMTASFLVGTPPGQPLDVTLLLSTSALAGGYVPFAPYELTVRDPISGKAETFTVSENRQEMTLHGFTVADDFAIHLVFEISEYPDPATMQVSLIEIQVDSGV